MNFKAPEEHSFFTESECTEITNRVLRLRENWVKRDSFYTLGAASYLDVPGNYDQYKNKTNPILQKEFGFVYEKLKIFFQSKLGKPVKFDLAWPGFHVFEYKDIPVDVRSLEYLAGIHVDTPHKDHNWGDIQINEDTAISFTIPVKIPQAGAGLNYYDIESDCDYINFYASPKEFQKQLLEAKKRIDYKVGNLYCHEFGFLHQISNDFPLTSGDMRITIQGHGVLCNEEYYTFFF